MQGLTSGLGNDSDRGFQLKVSGGQWQKDKCAHGFSPVGSWLATPEEVDAENQRLRSWVNGQPRQDPASRGLIFGVEYLIGIGPYRALELRKSHRPARRTGVALSGRFPYLKAGVSWKSRIDKPGRRRQRLVD